MKIEKILALVCVFCFSLGMITGVSADEGAPAVSPALNVVSANSYVAVSSVDDSTLSIEAEDLERALNLSYVSCITITKLPDRSEGILYIGGSEAQEGQTISRANIGKLNFEFVGENINRSSFCFSRDSQGYDITCNLFSLKYVNTAPKADDGGAVQTSTYKNVSLYGKLKAFDKEGDKMIFEVVKQPANGLLKMSADGEYVYTPKSGYIGNDSFKYVVADEYGNYSQLNEIKLKVGQQSSSLVFCDMSSDEYHVAAIDLAEKGIMTASKVDGNYYFNPHTAVSRIEFLVMAMKSLGIEASENSVPTVFYDDEKIPENLKGYVNTAVKLGAVSGKLGANGELLFAPNDKITKAEAAVMLYNMSELEAPVLAPVFADGADVPAWAKAAIDCLGYNGILPNNGGYVEASEQLGRDQGAYMIYMFSQKARNK